MILWLDMKSTFRDSEETKEDNTVAMCPSEAIVYVSDRKIDGPVFILPCSDGYSCFIATENDGTKDRSMSCRIFGNHILSTTSVSLIEEGIARTYRLSPRPVCRHEVTETMDSVDSALLERHVIETRLEIGVREEIMNQ